MKTPLVTFGATKVPLDSSFCTPATPALDCAAGGKRTGKLGRATMMRQRRRLAFSRGVSFSVRKDEIFYDEESVRELKEPKGRPVEPVEQAKQSGAEVPNDADVLAGFDPQELVDLRFKLRPLGDVGEDELPECVDDMDFETIELTRSPSVATFCGSEHSIRFSERSFALSPIGMDSILNCGDEALDFDGNRTVSEGLKGDGSLTHHNGSGASSIDVQVEEDPDLGSLC